MKISIITVVKNSKYTILKCIESVFTQTYKDIEHIIIDGGSSDGTLGIIKEYNKHNILVSEPDLGIYDAINKGILLSTGEVVGLLHADDFFANNEVIESVVKHFHHYNTDALFAKVAYVDLFLSTKIKRVFHAGWFKPWMFRFGFAPPHPSFYAKKELFTKYGYYRTDINIAGDFELMLRFLYLNNIKAKYINECWVIMRLGGKSTSGIKSVYHNNKDTLYACKANNVYSNMLFIYAKYLFKWWGFLFKKI